MEEATQSGDQGKPAAARTADESFPGMATSSMDARDFFHREIHFEHQLISSRMTWYITSQSFLMTAFAIAGNTSHTMPLLTDWFLPVLGLTVSGVIWLSLVAALASIQTLRRFERILIKEDNRFTDLRAWNSRRRSWRHFFGMLPPLSLPLVFIGAWIVLIVLV